MGGGRLAVYHTAKDINGLGYRKKNLIRETGKKALEACKIIIAASIWNVKYGHAFKFEHKWEVFDMKMGL